MFEQYLTETGILSRKQPQELKNQWYIQNFQKIHGDLYNYSKVQYTNARTKIEIVCKEHGSFYQTPSNHILGHGCPKCSCKAKKSTKECVQSFIQVHGDTYNYSKVEYIGRMDKVEILCEQHGSFFQTPNNHLTGQGCPKCQNQSQNTLYVLKCLILDW